MAGWVRREPAQWTELRVHGVSGKPPERMLEHSTVRRVSGDASSGFYRRVWETEPTADDDDRNVVEAYSWGSLTAGSKVRALWLLLIPFLLANVAFYARPVERPGVRQSLGEAVQRLFALTITATLVLATVNVSMDFVGWQCVRPAGARSCGAAWVGWLTWPWLATPGRRIAVSALVPLAVIALLWWLANKTWSTNEDTAVDPEPARSVHRSPLENRRMWNSCKPVRRLRAVHVMAALALVGILALAPFVRNWRATPVAGRALMVALLGMGILSIVLACLPSMSDRPAADEQREGDASSAIIGGLPWLTAALVALSLGWLALAGPAPAGSPGAPRTSLPWLSAALHVNIAAQVALLVIMIVLLFSMMRGRKASDRDAGGNPAAWHGYATAVVMLFASALAGAYAAALVLAVGHLLGKPMPRDRGLDPLVTPMPYFWIAAVGLVVAVVAAVLALGGYLALRWAAARKMLPVVRKTYPDAATDPKRAMAIARQWARATLDDTSRKVAGWFVGITLVLVAVAFAFYALNPAAATDTKWLSAMANVGDWLIGLFAAGLVYVGRRTFQNADTRRSVSVIWDLGTFWPRAVHPLAPPCYAERAVPQLIKRIDFLRRDGRNVLLSCHSQGTVLGAAVVMQLTYAQSGSVALLTYGSPLRRLYARFFPAYFGSANLERAGSFLLGSPHEAMEGWPWRNLYRPSDPIGGAVFTESVVDMRLVDPVFGKAAGDISDPPTLGHSSYSDDPCWADTVQRVKDLRAPRADDGARRQPQAAAIAPTGSR